MTGLIYPEICALVNDALNALKSQEVLPADLDTKNVSVEQPRDMSHGDFATNAAMVLCKPAKTNPRMLAEKLTEQFNEKGSNLFEAVEIAGPGFINFRVKPELMKAQTRSIVEAGEKFGESTIGGGTKINVEFVSANPTGPLHAGHMRGAIFGDTLANLLKVAGYNVWREYLINDAGNQIRVLVQTVHLRYKELFGEEIEIPEGCYPGEYIISVAEKVKERDGDKWLKVVDFEEILDGIRHLCVDTLMENIRKDVTDLGIAEFDEWFSEYKMQQTGLPEKIMKELRDKGLVYDGTLPPPKGKEVEDYEPEVLPLFKSTEYGDDVDRPMKNSRGEFTYFGADIAYHQDKLNRGSDKLVNVWGADHAGAVKRLVSAVSAVVGRDDAFDIKLMQMAKFIKNGEPVKLSKRSGNIVTLRQILDEVGKDAARFWFLNRKAEAQFEFDLGKAIEQNNENPVFYVQYAHARMCSIYRQQKEFGISSIDDEKVDTNKLDLPQENELLQHLSSYPMAIEKAAIAMEPHRIAFYAYDLAAKFHSWYNACKFLEPNDLETTHARLLLVKASQQVLRNALNVLGVSAPESM